MKRNHTKVNLTNRGNGQLVEADLFEGISDENLRDYKEKWLPALIAERERYETGCKTDKDLLKVEDAHWNWDEKVAFTKSSLSHRHFVIESEGVTQGLMQLAFSIHHSRIDPNKHLVYIEYLSVAPWNRKNHTDALSFKGVGSILVFQAIITSLNEGFWGLVGLHALPGAVSYYKKLGMISFGSDNDHQCLEYFEMRGEDSPYFKHIGK